MAILSYLRQSGVLRLNFDEKTNKLDSLHAQEITVQANHVKLIAKID